MMAEDDSIHDRLWLHLQLHRDQLHGDQQSQMFGKHYVHWTKLMPIIDLSLLLVFTPSQEIHR